MKDFHETAWTPDRPVDSRISTLAPEEPSGRRVAMARHCKRRGLRGEMRVVGARS